MPGICRYPAKCTGHAVNQGGTADSVVRLDHVLYSSLTDSIILSGAFFIGTPLTEVPSKGVYSFKGRQRDGNFTTHK